MRKQKFLLLHQFVELDRDHLGVSRDGLATSLIVHSQGHSSRPELDYAGITRVITAMCKCQIVMFYKILSCEKILASVLLFYT